MKTNRLHAVLAAALAVAALARPAVAMEIAEVRGDFYYDSAGNFVGMKHADLPEGFERRPMSHREKYELLGVQLPERPTYLVPRQAFAKPAEIVGHEKLSSDKVIVKFVDGMSVRLRGGSLRAGGTSLPEVDAILAKYPEATLRRAFSTDERILEENKESGERISGRELADLNGIFMLTFDAPSQRGVDLANELLKLDIVEVAYLQAVGEAPACADLFPATPSWVGNQNYLNAAPDGVNAYYAWAYHAGGNGAGPGFWVADLEWGWCTDHEDMNISAADVLNGLSGGSDVNHGTAVIGEIATCNNAYGMTGISHDVALKMCDFDSEASWAANITTADSFLLPGEVMLLEIHIWGGPSGEVCVCNCPQFEYVPVEWDFASFLAIQTATANGQIVVEAGGNGSMNLDHARYGGAFNINVRDSGAIIVGAGTNNGHAPECWTDYGSRIDVHGYGDSVFSTGYGDWFNQVGCNQDYTSSFSGTSSASPIITGVCADLQGIANLKYGIDLSAAQMRTAVKSGGTPQAAPLTKNIGPMPNLVNAINWIEPDVVPWYVPAGWTYSTVPRSTADSNGGFAPLQAGPLPGNANGTFWNWTEYNPTYSYTPTINNPNAGLHVEDSLWWWCLNTNLGPGAWQFCGNVGPNTVKGGRHTILNRSDVFGVEDEWSEANDFARQFIWSGLPLAINAPVVRSFDPARTSTGYGPFFNAEGFSGTTSTNYWYAFATLPEVAGTDFDIYLNAETPLNVPQQGFGTSVAASSVGGDYSDFVVLDLNTVSSGTYYASGINWSGTANKVVEFDMDQGVVSNPGINGPYTLGAGEIVDLHEVFLSGPGVATRIQIEWLSGNANYGVSVHNSASGFTDKWSAVGLSDNYGPRLDEFVVVSPPAGDWHGVAVWKTQSADLNQAVTYNLIVSQLPNLTDLTPPGWYGPIVPRNTTDATIFNAPLPPTLAGNAATTSFNFSTFNQGPNAVPSPWRADLHVDDVAYWLGFGPGSTPASDWARWMNTAQGSGSATVKGGRHHLRLFSDALLQVAELPETDNNFTDWFSWSPLSLASNVSVVRTAGPVKDPLGFGPEYSCDGYGTAGPSFWSAVGVLPTTFADDYDVRTHAAYVGSKDGFGPILDWSGDSVDGNVDFAMVNYNVASAIPDFSVLNWNASPNGFVVERAEAAGVLVASPGIQTFGPFTIGANGVLDTHEMFVSLGAVGQPVYVSIAMDAGTANLGLMLFDGASPYHNKFSYTAASNAGGGGADEHLAAQFFASTGYHGIVVHKTNAADLPLSGTYRLVISVGGPATDAPQVEAAPTAFALAAPRPNPFGSQTSFRFDVPAGGGRATVAIYDLQGRRIATLADGEQPAGRHVLTWSGKDASGEKVAAGVYFVRMESAAAQETKKITLLR